MAVTTIGKLLVQEALPEKWRNRVDNPLDKKALHTLMNDMAGDNPDQYIDTLQKLNDIGRTVVTDYGRDAALSLRSLIVPPEAKKLQNEMRAEIKAAINSADPEATKLQRIKEIGLKYQDKLPGAVYDHSLKEGNQFAMQIKSGSRGNPTQLQQILVGDMLMTDPLDRLIPYPGTTGYAEGLSPFLYWVGASSARKGFCLSGETLVCMADYSTRKIKDVLPGEYVLGATKDGVSLPVKVVAMLSQGIKDCYAYSFDSDKLPTTDIEGTEDHKVLTMKAGSTFMVATGQLIEGASHLPIVERVPSVLSSRTPGYTYKGKTHIGQIETYDLSVDHPDHLFVLANGIIVSNSETQFATGESGYLSKQVSNVAHRHIVTMDDCGATDQGIQVDGGDEANVGAVLLKSAGPIPAGTILKADQLPLLEDKQIIIRSPETCQAKEGICSKCAGVRERGSLPALGEAVGVNGVRSFAEAITQAGLKSKHIGGVGSAEDDTKSDELTGFKALNQFVQVPKEFVGHAVLAQAPGIINKIEDAPQGGWYITSGDNKYHVPRERKILVKQGDKVDAGDVLSTGTPNPAEIVQYKGLGEGRRYFTQKFSEITGDAGADTHRRNIEVLSRAFLSKVRITDPDGWNGHLIDDVVDYDELAGNWAPREGAAEKQPEAATGAFLEKPYLHYTIGTVVTPKVANTLKSAGFSSIFVHSKPPPFEPEVSRAQTFLQNDKDWMVQMGGEGLKRNLLNAAQRGGVSNMDSTSYIPRLFSVKDRMDQESDKEFKI